MLGSSYDALASWMGTSELVLLLRTELRLAKLAAACFLASSAEPLSWTEILNSMKEFGKVSGSPTSSGWLALYVGIATIVARYGVGVFPLYLAISNVHLPTISLPQKS